MAYMLSGHSLDSASNNDNSCRNGRATLSITETNLWFEKMMTCSSFIREYVTVNFHVSLLSLRVMIIIMIMAMIIFLPLYSSRFCLIFREKKRQESGSCESPPKTHE